MKGPESKTARARLEIINEVLGARDNLYLYVYLSISFFIVGEARAFRAMRSFIWENKKQSETPSLLILI